VWMLTGDKQNTAIQIGLLCNLITSGIVLLRYIYPLNLASGHLHLTIRVALCKCFLHWSIAISCSIIVSLRHYSVVANHEL
jgi:magnesium-transporting ATPase (P-type)